MSKFRAHETFFIRKGWLYKGLKHVESKPFLFSGKEGNAMDILGIGANMVKALRYWLQAVGLTQEPTSGQRSQKLTDPLGIIIWENDRYIEEMGTLWLLHYKLVTNEELATSWYFFYNKFRKTEFNKEDFLIDIENYISLELGANVARTSLEDDFNCIINTYISRIKSSPEKVHPESNIDCPLGELELMEIVNKKAKIYKKCEPRLEALHPLIVLSVIVEQADGNNEIRINNLRNDEKNIGKVFNMNIILLINYLNRLDQLGYIKVNRTAGLDVIKVLTNMSFSDCIKLYYNEINR